LTKTKQSHISVFGEYCLIKKTEKQLKQKHDFTSYGGIINTTLEM